MNKVLRVAGACGVAFLRVHAVQGQMAPTITSVSPASAYNYAPVTITITGTAIQSGATIKLGRTTLSPVTFINSTTLTATAPAALLAGAYDVTVTNPDGGTATNEAAFTSRASRGGHLGAWRPVPLPASMNGATLLCIREPYSYFYVPAAIGGGTSTIVR